MVTRYSDAYWEGDLETGTGTIALGSGAFEGPFSAQSRFEDASGTNPEELIGAALSGCFSMALAGLIAEEGYDTESIETEARLTLDAHGDEYEISRIQLVAEGTVSGIDEAEFIRLTEEALETCPVANALAGTRIDLDAALIETD